LKINWLKLAHHVTVSAVEHTTPLDLSLIMRCIAKWGVGVFLVAMFTAGVLLQQLWICSSLVCVDDYQQNCNIETLELKHWTKKQSWDLTNVSWL